MRTSRLLLPASLSPPPGPLRLPLPLMRTPGPQAGRLRASSSLSLAASPHASQLKLGGVLARSPQHSLELPAQLAVSLTALPGRMPVSPSRCSSALRRALESSEGQSQAATQTGSPLALISALLALLALGASRRSEAEGEGARGSPGPGKAALGRTFIADAAAVVAPTVVNIVAKSSGFLPTASAGSGFIVSKDGYIVTNAHVVKTAKVGGLVEVTFSNGHKFPGRVWGMDEPSDIALVKLDVKRGGMELARLPVARIGDSSVLRAGEFVVAVGSPLQLMNSVTFGIVSAPARHSSELGMGAKYSLHDFIQTDAAINVGNSGGPLVNLDGEVVGINAMKAQGMDGVSFAIPMDTAWAIIQQLMRQPNVKVTRPYVGLRMVNFKPAAGYGSGSGGEVQVLITDVRPGSPAEKAGLRVHDVILKIDDKPVQSTADVFGAIGWEVGKKMRLHVLRNGGRSSSSSHDAVDVLLVTEEKQQ